MTYHHSTTYNRYYHPEKDEFFNPGKSAFTTGVVQDKETLLRMGYFPYVDPYEELYPAMGEIPGGNNPRFSESNRHGFLIKGPIVINGELAIQTYHLDYKVFDLLSFVQELFGLPEATDDVAAAAIGIKNGQFYHTSGTVKVRTDMP